MIRLLTGLVSSCGSYLTPCLLVLIIILLTLDTADRKPFLRKTAAALCEAGEEGCELLQHTLETVREESEEFEREHLRFGPALEPSKEVEQLEMVVETTEKLEQPISPREERELPTEKMAGPNPILERSGELPGDLVRALAAAMQEDSAPAETAEQWERVRLGRSFQDRRDAAVKLARLLDPEYWPLNGVLIHQLDIAYQLPVAPSSSSQRSVANRLFPEAGEVTP